MNHPGTQIHPPIRPIAFHNATDVAKWRMCIGCGACVYVCPEKKLELVDLLDEGLRPTITHNSCGSCTDCVDVCPGLGVSHAPVREDAGLINSLTESWGPVLEVWEGHAADAELRLGGSSGGLTSALALYCVEQGGMRGLVHVGSDDQARYKNKSAFSRNRAEILGATGSKYSPASPCDHLQSIEDADGPCVFVGKPCDVQALRKAQAIRPGLDANVGVAIGIFCAGTPSTQGTIDLLRQHGIDPDEVEELRYRGRGWPGSFAVRLKGQGDWQDLATYAEAWGFLQKYRPYRCYLCPDGTSEFADISCGDPWYREIAPDEPGKSLVVVRTKRGQEIVRAAIASGHVDLTRVEPDLLHRSQRELQYKRGAIWGRLLTMQALGVSAPRFQGFSLFGNWLRIPARDKLRSFAGTARRVFTRGYHQPMRYPWTRSGAHPTSNQAMNRTIVQRIYLRALRHLGMKKLSWDKQFETAVSYYGPRSENTINRVQELCRGGRLLEFGCGEGDLPFALPAGTYSSYAGYDISEVAIERARRRVATATVDNVCFEQCDIAKWNGEDSASLILAEECLYYLSPTNAEAFLSRCLRCLDDDGSILVIVHSATKHAKTLDICRRVCRVQDESAVGGRVFLTLKSRPSQALHKLN